MKEIALNILDIVQNSVRADAKNIRIEISESDQSDSLVIKIIDDGKGMHKEFLNHADDPFTTSRKTRKVGMGLPLLKMAALQAEGKFQLESEQGKGTALTASFKKSHIDRQPLGDIVGVIKLLLLAEPNMDFFYYHSTDKGEYVFSSREAKSVLEVSNFSDLSLIYDVSNMLKENLLEIGAEIT